MVISDININKVDIIEVIKERLKNDKKTEFSIACREIEKKALITLEKIL